MFYSIKQKEKETLPQMIYTSKCQDLIPDKIKNFYYVLVLHSCIQHIHTYIYAVTIRVDTGNNKVNWVTNVKIIYTGLHIYYMYHLLLT